MELACVAERGAGEKRVEAWREEEGKGAEKEKPGRGIPGERERGGTGGQGSECDRGVEIFGKEKQRDRERKDIERETE